ncbi:glucosamine--fructose-6-phosphate aminotransferase, isomerizing [Methanolobus tindarius DSM 2278]|uniref:Glutamine--fructose-6-phosphate aminotransferase [isomerizing] n=1 Tax=Methanolobus tindarius DSM 2278 TaxID=1090322 RepID=W9DPI7_METTI|nr:glutamine--fructose-6-phosphate transaminase (isomerizing) [Methanolobus tindarius]ETA67158.1 glucosamine--fructose-6-phosphate aminotransferase, isomerizing [Methanolobus tindarius DSM 2278]
MCGIVGYIGNEQAVPILLESLKMLEYRGYDSAGVTVFNEKLETYKIAGRIKDLEGVIPENVSGNVGIGHTRWATHGKPETRNAHPHNSSDISVVHNGIIENYLELKERLIEQGYEFKSDTDTEVIAHLLHFNMSCDSEMCLLDGLAKTIKELDGSYAIAALCNNEPGIIAFARKDSPLVIGIGNGSHYAASDVTAFLKYTKEVIFINDNEIGLLRPDSIEIYDLEGNSVSRDTETIEWDLEAAEKAGYEHFMLKEIHEQPTSIQNTFAGKLSELEGTVTLEEIYLKPEEVKRLRRATIIACGTSWNAGILGKYLFEKLAGLHTDVETASEFRYSNPVLCGEELTIAITQSGETADTLAAVRSSASYGCRSIAITNVVGSTITRESDSVLYTRAGPEIGVAATKTFTAQLMALYMLAINLGRTRGVISANEAKDLIVGIKKLPGQIQKVLSRKNTINECAVQFADKRDYFFIGRYLNFPVALEGALKLKEISYIHAEGYAAGELKHGPLALITDETPVVAIATKGHTYEKILSNIKEVKARNATVIAVADDDDTEIEKYVDEVIRVPPAHELLSPVLSSVALQLLSYYTALAKDCSIDKPRNLAKSVTVE